MFRLTTHHTLILVLMLAFSTQLAHAGQFHFVAIGDTAYNPKHDYPIYERLIGAINESDPAFTIHVGDTWGVKTCTEENHEWVRDWFAKYDHPVVYTPGDNEWTDCRQAYVLEAYSRVISGQGTAEDQKVLSSVQGLDNAMAGAGYDDTLASLRAIRRTFFSRPQSMGAVTMPLLRQADASDYPEMVENTRWEKEDVTFATVSVPGGQNGFLINDIRRAQEAIARNEANVAWLKDTFEAAAESKAVVIALHASMFLDGDGGQFSNRELRGWMDGPYYWVALAIRDLAESFGKPVLLINGDFHEFIVDRPFFVSQGETKPPRYGNVTRVQVYGAPELRAVRIDVDTETPWVFSFSPLYLE